jgi:hypothetical protein
MCILKNAIVVLLLNLCFLCFNILLHILMYLARKVTLEILYETAKVGVLSVKAEEKQCSWLSDY